MSNMERRIERAEEALGMGQEPITINVVWFGGKPLPPERRDGNFITRYVAYESLEKRPAGGTEHER
jgi:hypothetical protein